MTDRATDLARLNDAERRVLRMLAEGHTVKSIALAIGSTPAAVNERLREARRKTGVGSSRELGRLLKAQENRDEQMGMAERPRLEALLRQPPAEPWRPLPGALVMMTLLIGAVGATALLVGQAPGSGDQSAEVVDELIGPIPSSHEAPEAMYRKLRAEPRDGTWASRAERTLLARFSQIDHVGRPPAELRAICASSICEVAGTIDAPEPHGKEHDDPNHPMVKAVRELQEKPLVDDLKKAGLERGAAMFSSTPGEKKRASFIMYFKRVKS